MNEYKYDNYIKTAEFIKNKINCIPDVAVILGSGLMDFSNILKNKIVIKYYEIPNFPISTVKTHKGEFIFGEINYKKVLVMCGRFHFYEGYSFETTAYPIKIFSLLGIKTAIITNASGGINESFKIGDLMLIKDHIKFFDDSPLRGKNIEQFGERFFDMSKVYSNKLQEIAFKSAKNLNIDLKSGVYAFMSGPQFETPAEVKALRILGADAVGMSTVAEVIACAYCGLEVLGISCISNMASGITDDILSDDDVVEVGKSIYNKFSSLLVNIIEKI